MKMKQVLKMKVAVVLLAGLAVLGSCKKTDDTVLSSDDTQNVNSESVSASTSSETSDLANSVISNVSDTQLSSGRIEGAINGLGLKDKRLEGATITITGTGTKDNPSGTITIVFPSPGVTTNGVTRVGTINVQYAGRRLQPGSTRTITFDNYYRNSVKVDGTYAVSVTDSTLTNTDFIVTFAHTTNLTLTFPDTKTVTRSATYTAVWDYKIADPTKSTITHKAGGTAEGTNRKGRPYVMTIDTDIVYRADCFAAGFGLPYTGTKTILVNNLVTYKIDYGTDTCDDTVTITFGGKTVTITVAKDGN
jgi:hypothetical protein